MHAFIGFSETLQSVLEAVVPLVTIFLIFQLLWLKLPRAYVFNILKGTFLAACGLLLFMQGVRISFLPFGQLIGEALGDLSQKWFLIPFGFIFGLVTTWSEPSVRILADQVEEASSGSIPQTTVLLTNCLGVGVAVSLGFVRIAFDIPLLYLLVPGYLIAILIMSFSDKEFVAIAIDAGGVATGPMANTFLLAMGLGISSSIEDCDPLIHGLGLMALIALAPIVSIMVLGFYFKIKNRIKGVAKP